MKKLTYISLIVFGLIVMGYSCFLSLDEKEYQESIYYGKNVSTSTVVAKTTSKDNEEVLVKVGLGKLSASVVRLNATVLNITKGKGEEHGFNAGLGKHRCC